MLENVGLFVVEIMDVDGEFIDMVVGILYWCVGLEMVEGILVVGYCWIGFIGMYMFEDYCVCKCFVGFEDWLIEVGVILVVCEYY